MPTERSRSKCDFTKGLAVTGSIVWPRETNKPGTCEEYRRRFALWFAKCKMMADIGDERKDFGYFVF